MIAMIESQGLQFAQTWYLAAGLLCCALALFFYRKFDQRRAADLAKMAHPRFLPLLFRGDSPARRWLKRGLWLGTVMMIFTALARPQWGEEYREVKRRGIDLLFALDTSHSMLADDLSPNRLDRARMGILDFIDRLEGDRIGLVPFAGSAYALCPLTLDYDAFRESLQVVNTQMIPHQGTDLASAIREAERLFQENQNNQRILVLITDGEDLQGDVLDAAKKAHDQGMVIYTVGVGDPAGATIPVQYQNGRRDVMRDAKGEVVRTRLDETTLKKIAEISQGLYVPLGRGAEGLNTIYQEKLRLMPKTDMNQRMEKIPLERFVWPLSLAVLLWLIEFFLPDRRRVAALGIIALLLATSGMPLHAAESQVITYNRGTEAYQCGEFAEAVDALRDALRTPDLSLQQRTYYNLGNALYRLGQASAQEDAKQTIERWKDAIKAYDDALALRSDDEDARYNRDLVKKKLDELQQQQPQDQQQQDQQKQEQQDKQEQEEKEKQEQQQQQDQASQDQQDQQKQESESAKENQESQEPQKQDAESSKEEGKEEQQTQAGEQGKEGEEGKEPQQAQAQQAREMTEEEAKQLLESLRHEERRVIPIPQRRDGKTDNTTKGKTW